MPSHPHRYNYIGDAHCSYIIHFIFDEGLPYVNTSEVYGYLYETIRNIAKASEENSQLVPKHRAGVRYSILQDEHIQWLLGRLDAYPNITVESLHCQPNEVFQFPHHVSISCDSKAIQRQARFTLKLMQYELDNYNNEEHLRKHKQWCQKFWSSVVVWLMLYMWMRLILIYI